MHFTCNTVVPGSTVIGFPSTNTSRRLLAAAVAVDAVRASGTDRKQFNAKPFVGLLCYLYKITLIIVSHLYFLFTSVFYVQLTVTKQFYLWIKV